jgi:hypothetical protein
VVAARARAETNHPVNYLTPIRRFIATIKDYTDEFTILSISLIIILGFWLWIIITFYYNSPAPTYFLQCDPDKCATGIESGEKRCNTDATPVVYNPVYEVCNSRTTCDNDITPYAVTADGSTSLTGICDAGETCRCLRNPQCSYDTLVTFFPTAGPLGNGLAAGGLSPSALLQNAPSSQGEIGVPLTLNSSIEYCAIRLYHADRLVPRTGECNFQSPDNPTLVEAYECIISNPCTIGQLAFRPADVDLFTFNAETINTTPVGCVVDLTSAPKCTGGSVPVWDANVGKVKCLS